MDKSNLEHARTCVYNVNYHIVWSVKYRKAVLEGGIDEKLKEMLKGISGRWLMMKYPELKQQLWKGNLWNSSFYIETIGSVSEEAIQMYIERQKTRG